MTPAGLLAALAIAAAGEPAAPAPLTERAAVERALRADAQLSALAHRVEEGRALRDAAGRLEDPELRVQNLRPDRLRGGDGGSGGPLAGARVALRWEPPGLGQRGARRAEAEAEAARATADLALRRRELVARVRGLHARALGLEAELEVARAAEEERARLERLAERSVEQGGATVAEEKTAELDRLDATAAVEELEALRRGVLAELRVELGLPEDAALALSGEGAIRCPASGGGPAPSPRAHPLAAALQAELRAADAALTLRRLERLPWFSHLQAAYVVGGREDAGYWTLQLGIRLPLPGGGGGDRRALAAAQRRLEDEQRALAAAEQGQLRRALAEEAARAAVAQRRREAAAALEDGLARYRRHGDAVGALELGRLRARQLAARLAQLQAELECALARIELERLAGADGAEG